MKYPNIDVFAMTAAERAKSDADIPPRVWIENLCRENGWTIENDTPNMYIVHIPGRMSHHVSVKTSRVEWWRFANARIAEHH